MKKVILLSIALIASFSLMSQTVIFEDNFEAYAADSNLVGAGYKVWEGTALVVDSAAAAYEGSKYAVSDVSKNDFQLRRTVALEAGKTYTLTIATKSQDGAKHFVNILPGGDVYGDAKIECTNADWQLHTTTFTVVEGKENVTIAIYRWPKKVVCVDAIKLIEGTAAGIFSHKSEASDLVVHYMQDETINVISTKEIKDLKVYSLNGKLVNSSSNINNTQANVSVSALPKGIYVVSATNADGLKLSEKFIKY